MSRPHNPDNFSYDIYGGIDAELDAAFAENLARSTADGLDAAVQGLNRETPFARRVSPEFAYKTSASMEHSSDLFSKIGLTVPPLQAFENVNWEKLESSYTVLDDLGCSPELVVVPYLQNAATWKHLYYQLLKDDGGLNISPFVEKEWEDMRPPYDWSVCVIPATASPTVCGISYDGQNSTNAAAITQLEETAKSAFDVTINPSDMGDIMPDISTYLTLQALLLNNGRSPVDGYSLSWLKGQFDVPQIATQPRAAPIGRWYSDSRRLRIDAVRIDDDVANLGIRPTITEQRI